MHIWLPTCFFQSVQTPMHSYEKSNGSLHQSGKLVWLCMIGPLMTTVMNTQKVSLMFMIRSCHVYDKCTSLLRQYPQVCVSVCTGLFTNVLSVFWTYFVNFKCQSLCSMQYGFNWKHGISFCFSLNEWFKQVNKKVEFVYFKCQLPIDIHNKTQQWKAWSMIPQTSIASL